VSGSDRVRDIVIVGGGAAGWLAAGVLAAEHHTGQGINIGEGGIRVTLVESPDVRTIGVGEGTWPSMRDTLRRMGVSESAFITGCDASFKQASRFAGWVTGAAVGRLPALADASVTHAWAGLYEMTPDHNPVIGGLGVDGLFAIAGFSGHGFQHAPAAGRLLADVMLGRDPGMDLAPFAFARFAGGRATGEHHVV